MRFRSVTKNKEQLTLAAALAQIERLTGELRRERAAHQKPSAQPDLALKQRSGLLTANMSHDLRTPLNSIVALSELLMNRIFGEVNEKQFDLLKDIHDSGKRLLSLINNILDIEKIDINR